MKSDRDDEPTLSVEQVQEELRRVLVSEARGIGAAADRVDERWARAVLLLQRCRGKVILLAMGKSGHVARKIAASMASLGTSAVFVHAGEAGHGDLGMITGDDVALVISNSGETREVIAVLPQLKELRCPIVAITSKASSTLGLSADVVIELPPLLEADPHDLAPTTSSTVTLAIGDAIAVSLCRLKGFTRDHFARLHPAGALGHKARKTSG